MTTFTSFPVEWAIILAGAFGFLSVWSGIRGVLSGKRGMLGRIEGFRLVVFGLVLVGLAVAVLSQAKWLAVLSLGIGFVEILESSALIAVWKWGRRSESGPAGLPALGESAR